MALTLAGRSYLRLVGQMCSNGWRLELIYLALPSVEMSMLRVAERVTHGGHDIPQKDITRRFSRSLHNLFENFSYRVNRCTCFMNHGECPVLVFEQCGNERNIIHEHYYQLLLKEASR